MHGKVGRDVSDHPPAQRAECTIARGKRSAAPDIVAPRQRALKGHLDPTRNIQRLPFNFQRAGTPALPTAHTQTTH